MHYAKPLAEKDYSGIAINLVDLAPKYTAGMFLLLRSHLTIPPETPATHGDVNCAAKIKYVCCILIRAAKNLFSSLITYDHCIASCAHLFNFLYHGLTSVLHSVLIVS